MSERRVLAKPVLLLVLTVLLSFSTTLADNLAAPRSFRSHGLSPPGGIGPSAGVILPLHRAQLEQEMATLGVDAVYFASVQTGNTELQFSGVITESGDNSFSYVAKPGGVMELHFRNGLNLEYHIKKLEGDFSQPDGQRFLRKSHAFEFRLKSSTGIDAEVAMIRQNGAYANTVKGQLRDGAVTYLIDTHTDGEVTHDIDPPGLNYENKERVTGTISSDDFTVTLDETFRYHVVVFDNAIEDVEKTISNRWTIGGDEFELMDGRIFRTFKNGWAAELDSWSISGTLVRNKLEVGGLSFEQTSNTVDTVLSFDGQKAILFSDR